MTSIIQKLHSAGLIKPPPFVVGGTQYEVIMGSEAYGVSTDKSDQDIYGWCFPPKEVVFPHLAGEITGFGTQIQRFGQFQQHHIDHEGGQFDISIYNVIKYVQLCMENNPNMIDSLFVPQRCIRSSTPCGQIIRENRKLFLHKGAWPKFKGYAYSQLKKIRDDAKARSGKRKEIIEKHGYDTKFSYHVLRLMEECRQILVEGDIDLERNSEQLKSVRRGEWTLEQIQEWFARMEISMEELYNKCTLPWGPTDGVEDKIRVVLFRVLEAHYGSLSKAMVEKSPVVHKLTRIRNILDE